MSQTLDDTMGATLIGVIVAAALWGVSCVQVWFYYNNYPKDHWYTKLFVAAVWFSDTLHQILITHTVYTYLITNFGNLAELGKIIWSLMAMVLVNGVTAFMVQSFMLLRVWKLTNGSYALTGLVGSLVVGEFTAILYFCVKAFQLKLFAQLPSIKGASISVNVLGAAGDVLIALVLCTMLQKSRTGFRRSDSMIKKLTIWTMNTGLLTSLCAVASMISILTAPNTFIYIAFFVNLGRLYSNTLMATLNARQSIRTALDDNTTISLSRLKPGASSMGNSQRPPNNIAIKVDTTHEYSEERQYLDGEFLDMSDRKIGGKAA
ncbi:hypothetical protein PILCRDRAFT_822855 [Piloderma croceum F 1598]|uniref:DUF6534 domain-containing protein n=1 Tax=Piloderma croceum (strain F 1598) TaxID=765440 RepID=A0A0C3FJK1_PILCF|nr:hypothetical protein PILCRDRAFT_822855 [Piloderma croceum F 1598]